METQVADFVSPPRILSRETYPDLAEQTWSQGEYVEPAVIEQAFNLEKPLYEPIGVYLNQPNPYRDKGRQLKWIVPIIVAALLLVQVVSASKSAHRRIFASNFEFHVEAGTAPIVTQPFEIEGARQALECTVSAPVDNNWLELDFDLVNADTHQVLDTREAEIAFYHGYDDGYWSEGKRSQSVLVSSVPPGKYFLTIEATADPAVSTMPFSVTVVRDVVVWSNFWIALALVLIYPVYCWMRYYTFERARWLESDFAPGFYFENSNDSDD
jgi:hypothetical protein